MGAALSYVWGDGWTPSDVFETEYGCIRGKTFDIGSGRRANAFLSVPYAKPPVGELRFKAPEAPDGWNGIHNCTKPNPRPPQIEWSYFEAWKTGAPKSEDCLYLSIFAPDWKPLKNEPQRRPVLVYFHGGCFAMHSSAAYGDSNICKSLCSKDVVVVTVEYRLGILGFAATGDSTCIPNIGLRDQAFGLAWIHRNIVHFGGDPDNVTIFGQSAGGASVDYLALSPYTTDLFQKLIAMSGSACCSWALNDATHVRDTLRAHARILGWTTPEGTDAEKNESLMAFLKAQPLPGLELGLLGKPGFDTNANLEFDLTPVIDGDFLPEPLLELRRKAPKKIYITGATEFEWLLFWQSVKSYSDEIDRFLERLITEKDHENFETLRKEAKNLYVPEGASERDLMIAYVKMRGDAFITNGVHNAALDMLNAGHQVYLYNFEYFNKREFGTLGWFLPFIGATHCTELPYLFGKGIQWPVKFNETDRKVLENFTTLVANFAKYGDPNGKVRHDLRPLEESNPWRYINIGEDIHMKEDFHGRRAEFWRRLDLATISLEESTF